MATTPEPESTAAAPLPGTPPELHLLLVWQERQSRVGWLVITAASLAVNFLFLSVVAAVPGYQKLNEPERRVVIHKTPLYFPSDLLTQKAPNTRTPSKTIDLASLAAAAHIAPPKRRAPRFDAPKTSHPPRVTAEAPEVALNQPPGALPPGTPAGLASKAPPPPAPPPDQPFQNVGAEPTPASAVPKLSVPAATVQSAIQSLTQPSAASHGEADDDGGAIGQLAPQHAQVELQSDPAGADFRAYLASILSIVRSNWRRVIPQSVRMGSLRGRTVVEFIIARDGSIPKLVTADPSGSDALDRAAVAGLSMSNPLPPLPADYKGLQVRLAFTFAYNMPSH